MKINVVSRGSFQPRETTWILPVLVVNHEKIHGPPPLLNHENHENQRGFSWFIPTERNNVDFPGSRGSTEEGGSTILLVVDHENHDNFLVLLVDHENQDIFVVLLVED